VWDTKRQIIWLVAGLALGTFVVYQDARDEAGKFVPGFFAFMEMLLILIIIVLFYIYSRKSRG
jgi:cell division protein FtsW (lipid II flippase)